MTLQELPTEQPALPEAHETTLDVELIVCNTPGTELWRQAEEIEAGVFVGKQYVADKAEMDADYEPYEAVSRMVLARQFGTSVGTIRLMSYDETVGFKTINDASKGELEIDQSGMDLLASVDPTQITEVGTIGLEEKYRTQKGADEHMVMSLYGVIYALGLKEDKPYVLASFDEDYFGRFAGIFGPSARVLGPAIDYMGSKTIPVLMDMRESANYLRSLGAGDYVDELRQLGDSVEQEY